MFLGITLVLMWLTKVLFALHLQVRLRSMGVKIKYSISGLRQAVTQIVTADHVQEEQASLQPDQVLSNEDQNATTPSNVKISQPKGKDQKIDVNEQEMAVCVISGGVRGGHLTQCVCAADIWPPIPTKQPCLPWSFLSVGAVLGGGKAWVCSKT